jgi:hypothetical protein
MHVVRAEKFELVDTDGNRRASLEVTDNGVADLILFDGAGRDDAEYRVTRDGIATISFYDKAGDKRVLMGEVPGGRNGVTVYGPSDKLMAGLTVSPTNEASLTLYQEGRNRAELHVLADGHPGLALANESGKSIAGLPEREAPAAQTQQ